MTLNFETRAAGARIRVSTGTGREPEREGLMAVILMRATCTWPLLRRGAAGLSLSRRARKINALDGTSVTVSAKADKHND